MPRRGLTDRLTRHRAALADQPTAPNEDTSPADAALTDLAARTAGPRDVSEVDTVEGMFDLGPLLLPSVPDAELQARLDDDGRPVELLVISGEWRMSLAVFAAPRTRGLAASVRTQVLGNLGTPDRPATTSAGPWGEQVDALVETAPEGKQVPLRVALVDGPGWFVRAVFHPQDPSTGADLTAADLTSALDAALPPDGPLWRFAQDAVVNRGAEPMAPGTELPLILTIERLSHDHDTAPPAAPPRFAALP